MSGTNHRTWQQYHVGHFATTVQLDPEADSRNVDRAELANVFDHLIDLMDKHRMAATWAVSDPAHSAATSRILRSSVPHEVAILGDANWLGQRVGRTRFARELSRRVAQARSAGLSVHSLVARTGVVNQNVDLIVKQEITAIAAAGTSTRPAPTYASPRSVHYGVWEIPFTSKLPERSTWFFGGGWAIWRRVRSAAKNATILHLLIDAPAVCDEGRAARKTIAWLMDRVATLRDRGLVHVETLRATAARLSDVPAVEPQKSILHRAA